MKNKSHWAMPWRMRAHGASTRGVSGQADPWPRIKHLEFIQSVITRLATDSFITKGWALTVAGAIYGLAANHLNPWIAAVGFVPTVGFWWLDSYFLRQERLFRCLYDDVRQPDTPVALFSMHTRIYRDKPFVSWRRVMFSITLVVFYGTLATVGTVLIVAGIFHHVKPAHSARTRSAITSCVSSDHAVLGGQMLPRRSFRQRGTR